MTINRNQFLTSDGFMLDYSIIKNLSDATHSKISESLDYSAMLYQEASAIEDITLEGFLAFLSEARAISYTGKNQRTVIENFLTTRNSDPAFYVKQRLNIDTQNGDLVLPLVSSESLKVESIIIETDSNGEVGDKILNDGNTNIADILNTSNSTLFKYSKVVSTVDSENLVLSLSLRLKETEIVNSVFLKLYSLDNGEYPVIDSLEVSSDGVSWGKIAVEYALNKADYYIRFIPVNTQYIRIRFIQSKFNRIKTLFGNKYQYLIGIRELSVKRDEYDISGEYVSLPFSTGKTLSAVKFVKDDISNEDIKYMISANNGGKWIDIADGETSQLHNSLVGVLSSTNLTDIRVKILMDKTNSILSKMKSTEYINYNPENIYYLKNIPEVANVFYGKHISFGMNYTYDIRLTNEVIKEITLVGVPYDMASIKDTIDGTDLLVVINNGVVITGGYSIVRDTNFSNSKILFDNAFAPTSKISIKFKPFRYQSSNNNNFILPFRAFYVDSEDFNISSVRTGEDIVTYIPNSYFTINDDQTNNETSVLIKNEFFIKNDIYSIEYIPSFKSLRKVFVDNNKIHVPSLSLNQGSEIKVEYLYTNLFDKNLTKYYTPICKQYSVELI